MKLRIALLSVTLAGTSFAADATNFAEAFTNGKINLNLRLRYEDVAQTGLQDADALTLRTRLGFTTAPWLGWKAMLEAEDIRAADGDSYSQAGINPGGAGKAVIASAVGGTPELVEPGVTGYLYEARDVVTLSGLLRRVVEDAPHRNALGAAAAAFADRRLGLTALIEAHEALYDQLGCEARRRSMVVGK